MMPILLLVLLCPFLACLGNIIIFDLLIRQEYLNHREDWEDDGEPFGLVWTPPGVKRGLSYAFGNFHLQSVQFKWLFSTPDWARSDQKALRLLLWFRVFGFMWIGGFLLFVTVVVLVKRLP